MAAGLSYDGQGRAEAAYAHIPGWHRDGQTLRAGDSDGVTSREIFEAVPGLAEKRVLAPIYGAMGGPLDTAGLVMVDGSSLIDGGKARMLIRPSNKRVHGIYTDAYQLEGAQVTDMVDWMDSLAQSGELRYEAGFALEHGDRVVFTARLPGSFTVGRKDKTLAYLIVVVSFTGSVKVCCASIRAECANMTAMAFSEAKRNGTVEKPLSFTVPHRGTLAAKLSAAQDGLSKVEIAFKREEDEAARLAARYLDASEATAIIDTLIPKVDGDGEPLAGSAATRREVKVRVLREAWKTEQRSFAAMGDGHLVSSAWHLFNAFTRAADHGATVDVPDKNGKTRATEARGLEGRKGSAAVRREAQFASALNGKLARFKFEAKQELLALC